jgi:hypothetical protein
MPLTASEDLRPDNKRVPPAKASFAESKRLTQIGFDFLAFEA